MTKIGIGIITYNRLEHLKRAVAGVRAHTKSDYHLVVADDGGTDGTREWCAAQGIRVVTGSNAGVCWNKNRALFALEGLGCDPILLLEDDSVPVRDHWDMDWRIGTALFGHLAFAHPKLKPWLISGAGTPTDPFVNNKATAQCSSVSGAALREVGFFDTRFKGYGVGHAEWTTRLKRAGYGFKNAVDATGKAVKANLYIEGGLTADDAPTFKDRENIRRNEELFAELKQEPIYRHPWRGKSERERFLSEMNATEVNETHYGGVLRDMRAGFQTLSQRRLRAYDKAFRRVFEEPKSFLRTSAWLSSIALNIPAYQGEIVPWFNYTVIDLLKERVQPEWRVFEFGAGYSTLWWSSKVSAVDSVEHDEGWVATLRVLCAGRPADIRAISADPAFAHAIDQFEGEYDVVVVDGYDRPACVRTGAARLKPSGVLILDNSNRAEYRQAIDWLKARGFKQLALKGVAPMTYQAETTSFFYRPGNCFDF